MSRKNAVPTEITPEMLDAAVEAFGPPGPVFTKMHVRDFARRMLEAALTASSAPPSGEPLPTVFSDDGTMEWRVRDGNLPSGDLTSIELRQPTADAAWRREWRMVHGERSVAVTPDRIRAWNKLFPSPAAPPYSGGWKQDENVKSARGRVFANAQAHDDPVSYALILGASLDALCEAVAASPQTAPPPTKS